MSRSSLQSEGLTLETFLLNRRLQNTKNKKWTRLAVSTWKLERGIPVHQLIRMLKENPKGRLPQDYLPVARGGKTETPEKIKRSTHPLPWPIEQIWNISRKARDVESHHQNKQLKLHYEQDWKTGCTAKQVNCFRNKAQACSKILNNIEQEQRERKVIRTTDSGNVVYFSKTRTTVAQKRNKLKRYSIAYGQSCSTRKCKKRRATIPKYKVREVRPEKPDSAGQTICSTSLDRRTLFPDNLQCAPYKEKWIYCRHM